MRLIENRPGLGLVDRSHVIGATHMKTEPATLKYKRYQAAAKSGVTGEFEFGPVAGTEVAQLYLRAEDFAVMRPEKTERVQEGVPAAGRIQNSDDFPTANRIF